MKSELVRKQHKREDKGAAFKSELDRIEREKADKIKREPRKKKEFEAEGNERIIEYF